MGPLLFLGGEGMNYKTFTIVIYMLVQNSMFKHTLSSSPMLLTKKPNLIFVSKFGAYHSDA
jgi:hypothetical protein